MLKPVQHDKAKAAFTLAEVLITLTIIGVVAALTIPNLMQKYTEQETVKKVQKFHSNLANAYALATKEHGPKSEWGIKGNYDAESAEKAFEILFKPYFKIAQNCGFETNKGCLGKIYKRLDNVNIGGYDTYSTMYKMKLNDGSAVFFYTTETVDDPQIIIAYDTNGAKGPNIWGRDLFQFYIYKNDKFGPAGMNYGASLNTLNNTFRNNCNTIDTGSSMGLRCTAWVVYKGNLDYLHCNDLSWDGKDKCK